MRVHRNVVLFFVVTYALTWFGNIRRLVYESNWWPVPMNPFGPIIVAPIVVALTGGRKGLKEWWHRITRFKAPWQVYTSSVLIPLCLMLKTPLVYRLSVFLAASLVLLLLSSACARREDAIDFQVTLYNGNSFQLSQQAGSNATVVNFWYPSCPPCREEMPNFQQAWQEFQDKDVRFLGLFVPMGFDSEQDAKDFIAELGLTFDFATDKQGLIAQSYQVEYFPTTYFIDRQGKVVKMEISNLDTATITSIVNDMVGG